jgi:hypothetical protein
MAGLVFDTGGALGDVPQAVRARIIVNIILIVSIIQRDRFISASTTLAPEW